MVEIKWDEPPVDGRTNVPSNHWAEVADALRERSGEWALVAEDVAASLSSAIKTGRIKAFSAGGFEATTRRQPNGKFNVWARHVGGNR